MRIASASVAVLVLVGCGATITGAATTDGAAASSMEELEALAAAIEADLKEVQKPLDEADALLAEISTLKVELGASFDASLAGSTGASIEAQQKIDRTSAFNSCVNNEQGYGCFNTDELETQVAVGTAATVVFASAALGALIWAIVE